MSDVSQGPGWWLASDGKWYRPEQHPQYKPPPPPSPPPPSPPLPPPPVQAQPQNLTTQVSPPEGWRGDSTGRHEERYYKDDQPTPMVRDSGVTSYDAPAATPDDGPPPPSSPPEVGPLQPPPPSPPDAPPTTPVGGQAQSGAVVGVVGKVRNPWIVILLSIVTLGIYGLYWQYAMFKEMKDYSGQGIGGALGLVFAFLLSIVNIFLMPSEIGNLYAGEGQQKPLQGTTGFWVFLPLVGVFIWLFKVQGHLNKLWEAHGAVKQ